jgi:endonuclease/exonuclease/phosphatase family metal-dependent hydrolase
MMGTEKIKRIISAIISVLTVFSVLVTQVYLSQLPERDIYDKADGAVRIMSFNVLSERFGENAMINRRGIVTQTIAEYYPDSFGVQEATVAWMQCFKNRLPEYDYVGRATDFIPLLGGYSAVFYLKDKYEVVDSGTFWLSRTPDKPSKGWDADSERVCTWAVLKNKSTGEQYAHINTHLDNKGALARQNSVPMILAKAAEFDMPVVCTGDFNFRENSELYITLTADDLRDTKFLAPDTMSKTTYNGFNPPESQTQIIIDFVLVNSQMTPLVYRVVTEGIDGRTVSDHYPVYADVLIDTLS